MGELDNRDWRGHEVVDRDGDKVGEVDDLLVDGETGRAEWAIVNTGLLGMSSTLVPLTGAHVTEDERIQVAHDKGLIDDAPGLDPQAELSERQEAELYRHYGMSRPSSSHADEQTPAALDARDDPGVAPRDRDEDEAELREREAELREREQRLEAEERDQREREKEERRSELEERERELREREAALDEGGTEPGGRRVGAADGPEQEPAGRDPEPAPPSGGGVRLRRYGSERR